MNNLICPNQNTNFLSPNSFQFKIDCLPNLSYFCTSVGMPNVSLPVLSSATPLSYIKEPSSKLEFESLNIGFIVDSECENWLELYNWMRGLGFPESNQEFTNYTNSGHALNRGVTSQTHSNASLLILGSNRLPAKTINFKNCIPTFISGFSLSTSNTDVQYVAATATFEFEYFTIE